MSLPARLFPPRARLAAAAFVGAYPLVTLILYAIGPYTADWATWQRSFIVAALMVLAMVFWIIPFITRRFGGWIAAGAAKKSA